MILSPMLTPKVFLAFMLIMLSVSQGDFLTTNITAHRDTVLTSKRELTCVAISSDTFIC